MPTSTPSNLREFMSELQRITLASTGKTRSELDTLMTAVQDSEVNNQQMAVTGYENAWKR